MSNGRHGRSSFDYKLTGMVRERCRCCFAAQNLEKLCSPTLDVYLSVCNYQGFDNDDIQIETCARCCEFLKEVLHFKIKCHAVDEILRTNPNFEDYDVESLLKKVIDENSSRLYVKAEAIDENDEIDQIDIQINKVELDSDHENIQTTSEISSACPLDSIEPNNGQLRGSVHLNEGNLSVESCNVQENHETLRECDKRIDKRSLVILIKRCDVTKAMISELQNGSGKSEEHEKLVGTKRKNKSVAHTYQTRQQTNLKSHATNERDFNLNKHKSIIQPVNERFFECDECSYITKYRGNLITHIVRKHRNPKPFSCNQCNFTTKVLVRLKKHAKIHQKRFIYPFKCTKCSFKTISRVELEDHTIREHAKKKPYKCDECKYRSETKKDLETHKKKHVKSFKCDHCDFKTITLARLRHHTKTKPYNCCQCRYHTKLRDNLNKHKSAIRPVNIKFIRCNECSYRTRCRSKLRHHIKRTHSKEHQLRCEFCHYRAKLKKSLIRHKSAFHWANAILFECNECSYKTPYKNHIKKHIIRKTCIKEPFSCNQCHYQTKLRSDLYKHKSTIHPANTRLFECNECSYKTKQKYNLNIHIQRNKCSQAQFNCDQCHYHTKLLSDYHKHKSAFHPADARLFECNECSYKTNFKSNLAHHLMRKNCFERPFSCDQCHYHTKLKSNLNEHKSAFHSANAKCFDCNECFFRTKHKGNLIRHFVLKNCDERPFCFDECHYHIKYRSNLNKATNHLVSN